MSPLQNPLPNGVTAPTDKLLTTDEVAQWLGIKRCTLEKARSTRLGDFPPFIRCGRVIRYRRSDVDTWLWQRTFNTDGSQARVT